MAQTIQLKCSWCGCSNHVSVEVGYAGDDCVLLFARDRTPDPTRGWELSVEHSCEYDHLTVDATCPSHRRSST